MWLQLPEADKETLSYINLGFEEVVSAKKVNFQGQPPTGNTCKDRTHSKAGQ